MVAYSTSTASNSGGKNSSSSSAYSMLQRRHTIHPKKEICAFIHFMCILFHFLPFCCSCDHVNYLRWTSIEFYWQTSTTKSKSLKYLYIMVHGKEQHAHGDEVKKSLQSTIYRDSFSFWLGICCVVKFDLRRCWASGSVCMCLYVYNTVLVKDIHSVHKKLDSFPLGFDNKFSWSRNSIQQQQHRS